MKEYKFKSLLKHEKTTSEKLKDFLGENRVLVTALVLMVLFIVLLMMVKGQARADFLLPFGSV